MTLPPTISDFNYRLDAHCYFAEQDEKVENIARQIGVWDTLVKSEKNPEIISFFYTNHKQILDLALFISSGEKEDKQFLCFYFKDFLRNAYDIGAQLKHYLPAELIDQKAFVEETLSALKTLVEKKGTDSLVESYAYRDSWGFFFRKYKGMEFWDN